MYPVTPQTSRNPTWGFDPSAGTPTVLGNRLKEQSDQNLPPRVTLAQRWTDEKKSQVKVDYMCFLDHLNGTTHDGIEHGRILDKGEEISDANSETDGTDTFITRCMVVVRTFVVPPPSHSNYRERHQNMLSTLFSYHPRLAAFVFPLLTCSDL